MSKLYKLKNYKFILVIYVLILNTLGVFLVGSASPGDQKKQIIGMVSGIVIMVILSLIDYSFMSRVILQKEHSAGLRLAVSAFSHPNL